MAAPDNLNVVMHTAKDMAAPTVRPAATRNPQTADTLSRIERLKARCGDLTEPMRSQRLHELQNLESEVLGGGTSINFATRLSEIESQISTESSISTLTAGAQVADGIATAARIAAEYSQLSCYAVFRNLDRATYSTVRHVMPNIDPTTAADVSLMAQRNPEFRRDLQIASLAADGGQTRGTYNGSRRQFRENLTALVDDTSLSWSERQRLQHMRQVLSHYPPENIEEVNTAMGRYRTQPTAAGRAAVLQMLEVATERGHVRIEVVIQRTVNSEAFVYGQSLPAIAQAIQSQYGIDIRHPGDEGLHLITSDETRARAVLGLRQALHSRNDMTISQFMLAARGPQFLQGLTTEEQGHIRMLQLHDSVNTQLEIEHLSNALRSTRNPQLQATLMDDIQQNRSFDEIMAHLPPYLQRRDDLRERMQAVFSDPNNPQIRTQFLEAVARGDTQTASTIITQAHMSMAERNGAQIDQQFSQIVSEAERKVATVDRQREAYFSGRTERDLEADRQRIEALKQSGLSDQEAAAQVLTEQQRRAQERALRREGRSNSLVENIETPTEREIKRLIDDMPQAQRAALLGPHMGRHNEGSQANITVDEVENAVVAAHYQRDSRNPLTIEGLQALLQQANFAAPGTPVSPAAETTLTSAQDATQTGPAVAAGPAQTRQI